MTILDRIIVAKRLEISTLLESQSIDNLEEAASSKIAPPSFFDSLNKPGPCVITEFKRKSPSKGILNVNADIETIIPGYIHAGANAISILTDIHFDGYSNDLSDASKISQIPLLRKDFIIHKYQILEAKVLGASAILLIAAVLTKKEIELFTDFAYEIGLDVLLEIHDEIELEKISDRNNIIGINNRNLATFKVDLEQSIKLAQKLPEAVLKISESGISSPETALKLYDSGFKAFLIGENFMKTENPGESAEDFIKALNS